MFERSIEDILHQNICKLFYVDKEFEHAEIDKTVIEHFNYDKIRKNARKKSFDEGIVAYS